MPEPQGRFKALRSASFVFIALACMSAACSPTIPPATPASTLVPATVTLAASVAPASTATASVADQ